MTNQAAIYLRSSKDRSDVSIAVQRRDLHELAKKRQLIIVEEFVDAVESGKTENRPGFQLLVDTLKSRDRSWKTLILLDTSRLSRRQFISHFFEHEAEKQGVTLIYKSLPDADPISSMMLKAILQAMDQWHSMISKQKGLSGMAENVRQGYRAGGSAPRGYALDKIETGAVRDGKPVTKSRLIVSDDADLVAQLLKQRAQGISRRVLHSKLNITWPENSTLGMEWNALTYAGHTVWNVHAERRDGKTIGGSKRRPRVEWQITKNTHPALITDKEAEFILHQLETSNLSKARRTPAKYLLTGLLQSRDGLSWHGDAKKYYRANKGRGLRIKCDAIDQALLMQVKKDLQSKRFISKITKKIKSLAKPKIKSRAASIKRELASVSDKINNIIDIMAESDNPTPFMRKVESLEQRRNSIVENLKREEQANINTGSLSDINEFEVQRALIAIFKQLDSLDSENLKDFIRKIVDRIVIDPENQTRMLIHYSINIRGFNMASPRGFEPLLPP
ncbi:MAG: hypothetical protein COA83_09840 [Methylophaga sp.]|nr:MAG: hypothetical protein COA83_09840 [Methylophaga sp.]